MFPGALLATRYELLRPLGQGGMGQVWLALDRVLGREVAIKTIDVDGTGDATVAERFRREGQAAAALVHEHVVTVFDSGTDAGIAYLVMQLLPGPTVADLLRHGEPLALEQAVTIAEQTAAALAAIHSIGIVHRDIKPANLVFDGSGRLKVVDFGIASVADAPAAQLTAASTILGSAAYMAPEQAEGSRVTPATDLYALGCVLMTLVTGTAPFTGEHPLALLQQHVAAPAPRLAARRPEVPAALDELVDRLLAKAPEARGDAARVRDELASIRAALPVPAGALAIPFEGPPESVDAGATAVFVGGTTEDVPRTRRRSAARVVLPAVVLAAIAALALAVLPGLLQPGGVGEAIASQLPAAATASPPPAAIAETAVADGASAAPATATDPVGELASGEEALAEGSRGAGTPAPSRSAPAQPAPTAPSSTEPAPSPTEPAPPPPEPAPEEPAPVPSDALAGVRAAIAQAIESGALEGDAGGALGERLAAIEASLADDRTEEARAALGELQGQVAQLQEAGAVTPDAAAGIQAAIDDAAASLP